MNSKSSALFLDRDGVINHDPGDYTMSVDEFIILPTVIEALFLAQEKGYKIIIITNQGGIAKGLYNKETVELMHQKLHEECQKKGISISGIFYSPHHPDFGNSLTRKPERLLMERAIALHSIDVTTSTMIGDRERDIQCAASVGVKGILIPTNAPLIEYVSTLPTVSHFKV
jgi:D-glycero-D-manno-heptose 1,7-bisphosphate phosphatase